MKQYIIIGNGSAGISAAETIRSLDRQGKITVISAEPYPLYSRPGLAYYLLERVSKEGLFCRSSDFYEMKKIEQIFSPAQQIDWVHKAVILDNGLSLPYDKLLLATGAKTNQPKLKGIELQGVVTLSTLNAAHRFEQLLPLAQQGVVVGGGITAMELVEIFNHHGLETHYLLRGDRFWQRLFTQPESELIEQRLREQGIHLHPHTEIAEIMGEHGRVVGVKTNTAPSSFPNWSLGTRGGGINEHSRVAGLKTNTERLIPCQMVGIAIGVTPNTDLVENAPIACDRGILVNENMETTLPDIYAAGDVAQVFDPVAGRATLDLLWHSALKEGRAAGVNMTGRTMPYKKGIPFNTALLLDIPFTSIGYISPPNGAENEAEQFSLMRGFSESWLANRGGLSSAPVDSTLNQYQSRNNEYLRLAIRGNHLVGGMILGSHTPADAVHDLISKQIDISPIKNRLLSGTTAAPSQMVVNYWRTHQTQARSDRPNGNGKNSLLNGKGVG